MASPMPADSTRDVPVACYRRLVAAILLEALNEASRFGPERSAALVWLHSLEARRWAALI